MKKVLFATTALVLTAGTAMAEVKISGSGRVGLTYLENRSPATSTTVVTPASTGFRINQTTGVIEAFTIPASSVTTTTAEGNDTQVDMRLRFNIDASKETDAGVTFGGRIRMQYTQGDGIAGLSAAYVYAEASGFHVEVGNSNTAFDSVALMYNSEIGYIGNSQGDPQGSYFSFSSGGIAKNRVGIFASYSVGDLNARLSYVTPDQTGVTNVDEEISISFDYKVGQFTVALAAAQNGNGRKNNDLLFLGAEYALNDSTNVGITFNDNGKTAANVDVGNTVTLYGNTKLASGIGLRGYITKIDNNAVKDDIAAGIGADYDLGGATLAGGIETRFSGQTYADVGVSFSF